MGSTMSHILLSLAKYPHILLISLHFKTGVYRLVKSLKSKAKDTKDERF